MEHVTHATVDGARAEMTHHEVDGSAYKRRRLSTELKREEASVAP